MLGHYDRACICEGFPSKGVELLPKSTAEVVSVMGVSHYWTKQRDLVVSETEGQLVTGESVPLLSRGEE